MKNLLTSSLTLLLITILSPGAYAHDGHADPVLEELNDYLMAIQIMRADDERATAIFKTWHELRTASWRIRELTDEENLLINADEVMEQISRTRALRVKLLRECRTYFEDQLRREPGIYFEITDALRADWQDPLLEVQLQHRKVILIRIDNRSDAPVELQMRAGASDEILFWNKHVTLEPQTSRYTFAVAAPLAPRLSQNTIELSNSLGRRAAATIRLQGLPTREQPYRLLPGEFASKVKLPEPGRQARERPQPFREAIQFNITDKLSGQPLSARVAVADENGDPHWFPLQGAAYGTGYEGGWRTPLWEHQPGPYFYLYGQVALGVSPAGKTARIYRGFEYLPATVSVPEGGQVDVALERWIDMPARGWYSGHTHIHTTDAGMPVQFGEHWPLVARGEDLQVSAILTLKGEWETHAIYADEYPMGKREAFSTDQHLIVYGEEFRNNPYGHLAFLGLDELIQPISTGALGELGGADYPPNAAVLDQALDQGAATIAAHFGNFTQGVEQIQTPWPSTGFEMPIDIALGKIHLAEIYGNGGQLAVWYDILNCGFRVAATAGPDWAIKDSPRVYVQLGEQEFTFANWLAGLKWGRSFITTGPMLFFRVNGQLPGSEILLANAGESVRVTANALLPAGAQEVELVFNGEVIATGTDLDTEITISDSGWLAARCEGAHSNPVYISVKGRPAGQAGPARKFMGMIDRLEEWVQQKGLFDNEQQKVEVLRVIERGRAVYEGIIERAVKLDRE